MWRALVVSAVLAFSVGPAAQAHAHSPATCHGRETTAMQFAPFSAAVWDAAHWQRGAPQARTVEAQRLSLRCAAGPGHRHAMRLTWRRDETAYYAHRSAMLWRKRVKPFVYPDGSRWAVPYPIAWCESGGNYYVGPYGAYGLIMEATWMPPREQDEIAHRLFLQQGEGPWAPYESGCAYR